MPNQKLRPSGFSREVSAAVEVVFIGAVQVRAGGQEPGVGLRDGVDGHGTGGTGGVAVVRGEGGDVLVGNGGVHAPGAGVHSGVQFRGKFREGLAPFPVHGVPGGEGGFPPGLEVVEVGADVFGNVVAFPGGDAPVGMRFFQEFGPAFAVALGGAFNAGDALTDDGFGDDELGLAVLAALAASTTTSRDGFQVVHRSGARQPRASYGAGVGKLGAFCGASSVMSLES